jgi:hypothetical protein
MTEQPVGPIVDGLGVTVDFDDGVLVTDAVVVLKTIDPDGHVHLCCSWGEGMSWVERLGMLRAAERMELPRKGGSP